MNMLTKSLTVGLLAAGVVVGGASAASAKPAICADIGVPAKVRLAEGCFLPDSGPAPVQQGRARIEPTPPAAPPELFTMPEIQGPDPIGEKPAEKPDETSEVSR